MEIITLIKPGLALRHRGLLNHKQSSQCKGMNEMQTRLGYILQLQNERQSVRREDNLDQVRTLERQIAQVDAEIDQRMYQLYGLTDEEINIVEGR